MKDYSLVQEHDSHFDLHHKKDGPFVVAKHSLDNNTLDKIRRLPMYQGGVAHYAEGTEDALGVQPEDAFDATAPAMPPSQYATSMTPFAAPAATQTAPEISVTPETKPTQELEIKPTVAPKKETPELPGYLTSTQAMLGAKPAAQPQGQAPMADQMGAFNKAFDQMKAANAGMAAAQAQAADQAMQAQQKSEADMLQLKNKFETELKTLDETDKKLFQDVMSQKIDPNRVWNNMSTGNRVTAGISILLGGLGQGLTGAKSNPALDVINQAIDRDIDAQKANLQKQNNLLAFNLNKYGRLDAATAATRMQLLAITQAQINKAAAGSQNSIALNQAKMANAQIDLQKAQLAQSIAGQQTMQSVLQTPNGIPPNMVTQLPTEVRETLVMTPNGNFYPAINKQAAERVNKSLEPIAGAEKVVNDAISFMGEGRVLPGEDRRGTADVLNNSLTLEIKNIAGLGVLSKDDMKIVDGMKPDLTAQTFRGQDLAKAKALQNFLKQKIDIYYQRNIPNYNPSGIKETPVMGR